MTPAVVNYKASPAFVEAWGRIIRMTYSEIPMIDLTWSFQSTLQICPPARCAGWAWNPKGPQITPFCHQMGRHPTIWDFKTGIRHRIPARISPWGSRGLNPNFLFVYFGPQKHKEYIFWKGFEFIRDP